MSLDVVVCSNWIFSFGVSSCPVWCSSRLFQEINFRRKLLQFSKQKKHPKKMNKTSYKIMLQFSFQYFPNKTGKSVKLRCLKKEHIYVTPLKLYTNEATNLLIIHYVSKIYANKRKIYVLLSPIHGCIIMFNWKNIFIERKSPFKTCLAFFFLRWAKYI